MPAGSTYTPIATTTLGSSQSSVSFNSFSGYTDLVLVSTVKSTAASLERFASMRFNGDSGSNYSSTVLYGEPTSFGSYRRSNGTGAIIIDAMNPTGGSFTTNIVQIQNYSNSTTNKTLLSRWSSSTQLGQNVLLWRSTAAITSFEIIISGDNFPAGCTFTLYGIAAA